MIRKTLVAVAACALLATSAAWASSTTTTLKLSGTIRAAVVPTDDGKLTIAGPIHDTKLGAGAIVFTDSAQSVPYTLFYGKGSVSGITTFKAVVNPDGTITLANGKLSVTKGTGAYKGATGSGTVTGGNDAKLNFKLAYKLTVKFPK